MIGLPKGVCAPVHRSFPPRPTLCLICKVTDVSECPLRSNGGDNSEGNYRNLRGDTVHDGDVITQRLI